MYGDGSKFAYNSNQEVHLDGKDQESSSKRFYKVPDNPPDEDGIKWLDPTNVDLASIFSSEGFN